MVGTVKVARPGAPEGRCKHDHGQEKEDAGYFKPQDAAYAAKRTQKSAYATRHAPCCLSGCPAGGPALGGCVDNGVHALGRP
jgi:hypothetical protein